MAGLTYQDGIFYGTTDAGGGSTGCGASPGCGTVFEFNPANRAEHVLYRFTGGSDGGQPQAPLIYQGGSLFGTATSGGADSVGGTVFSVDPTNKTETVLYSFGSNFENGAVPVAGLIFDNGVFYGTTSLGGFSIPGFGTVFSLTP